MNCKPIDIEITSIGENFSEAEIAKASWLPQRMQKKNGIPDANVIRSYNDTESAARRRVSMRANEAV